MRPGRGGTERKEWSNLFFLRGGGQGADKEGRVAGASQKRCESNCLQYKEAVYLLTIGYNDGN